MLNALSDKTNYNIVVWGINDLYAAFNHKLPKRPSVLLDKHSSEVEIIRPEVYTAREKDILVVFSITSYGQIFLEAMERGFKPDRIYNISQFDETLTKVDFVTKPHALKDNALLCGRINGKVRINEGLLLVSDQHKTFIDVRPKASLIIDNVTICENSDIRVIGNGILSLGKNSVLSQNTIIRCVSKISIGNDCAISWNVTIMDSDGDYEITTGTRNSPREVRIEDNVWIGHGTSILKGVTIGKGSIIAAHSLVNKDVPPNTIYGGVPARLIRENIQWGHVSVPFCDTDKERR